MAQVLTREQVQQVRAVKKALVGRHEIKQTELEELRERQLEVETKRAGLREIEKALTNSHDAILAKLNGGWATEFGELRAEIVTSERRTVAWKEALVRRCGPAAVDEEQKACVASVTEKVVVRKVELTS